MDLAINGKLFVVAGASSGFGKAIAVALLKEGADVIAIARNRNRLEELNSEYPRLEILSADVTNSESIVEIINSIGSRRIEGALINAGGPPAKSVMETTLKDWDDAYRNVLRWKVEMTQALLPKMMEQKYGRILYIESFTVKQPLENLVLSNSMRLAVVGYVKTVSNEMAHHGITCNILAPGYHTTAAMDRLFKKKMEQTGMSMKESVMHFTHATKVGFLGAAEDLASLAVWLLSPHSRYLTGQTISVDGGLIAGTMG